MNKAELVDAVANQIKSSRAESEKFLDAFIKIVSDNMANSDDGVRLVGFGTFKAALRAEAVRRNPQTGKEMTVPAKRVPKFVAGKSLRELIAG